MNRTIPGLLESCVGKFGDSVYMWEKITDKFLPTTYLQTRDQVYHFAAGLLSHGIQKGDRLALLSEGKNRWVISELGIAYTGAINVPLSVKLDPVEIKFRMLHSGCVMAIVSSGQLAKIREIRNDLPELKTIIVIDPIDQFEPGEIYFEKIVSDGDLYLASHKADFDAHWQNLSENDPVNICYTSGTTADPKGIVLSHLNYYANIVQATELFDVPPYHRSLLILPWDHAFAHTVGIYALMISGASLASVQAGKTPNETLKNIPVNIREIKPTFLLSVPALAKNFRKNVERGIQEKGPLIQKLFKHALKLAYNYNGNGWEKGKGLRNKLNKPLLFLYDKILFKKVREGFGGKLEFFCGGGALLDIELQKFFYAIGIPMLQGYGLTEASPIISANTIQKHKFGSSGMKVHYMELRICDDEGNELPVGQKGEIVVRGENVMLGYYKNETATAETIKNGWLYTGDLGYMDADGFLYVLGRFKSLLIANDGEKYSPEGIEEALVENSPFIEQVMLYNNQNPYTTALVVPSKEVFNSWLKKNGFDPLSEEGICAALQQMQSEIDQYSSGGKLAGMFPARWLPAAVYILEEPFTEQNKMVNSTMKMVRGKITAHYADRISFLYSAEAKNICNNMNKNAIKSLLSR